MNSFKPLYVQLKDMIIQRINSKEYLPGEKLPSERDMSETYKLNRMTVKKAIDSLVDEGYLYKLKNKGTFVVKRDQDQKIFFGGEKNQKTSGLSAIINEAGFEITNKVIKKGVISNVSFLEGKLNLKKGEEIYYIYRLRSVDGQSVAYEQTFIPLSIFEDVDNYDFAKVSLYDYMETKGHFPKNVSESMTVQKAVHPVEKIMGIDNDDYLFVFEFISSDETGRVVEFTISNTRTDRASCFYKICEEELI